MRIVCEKLLLLQICIYKYRIVMKRKSFFFKIYRRTKYNICVRLKCLLMFNLCYRSAPIRTVSPQTITTSCVYIALTFIFILFINHVIYYYYCLNIGLSTLLKILSERVSLLHSLLTPQVNRGDEGILSTANPDRQQYICYWLSNLFFYWIDSEGTSFVCPIGTFPIYFAFTRLELKSVACLSD